IDFLGTGGHAVVPPSTHDSGEQRVWDADGEPAEVDCRDLWDAVCELAAACGARVEEAEQPSPESTPPATQLPRGSGEVQSRKTAPASSAREYPWAFFPYEERLKRCAAYLDKVEEAISGQGGHDATIRASRIIRNDFVISDEEDAWRLLVKFNETKAKPPWTEAELRHKFEDGLIPDPRFPRGCKLVDPDTGLPLIKEPYNDPYCIAGVFLAVTPWRYWQDRF